jgi:hypothetical protein
VIQEVLALADRELYENRVRLERQLTKALPLVLADRVQMQQVLLNLIMNGIEAMIPVTDNLAHSGWNPGLTNLATYWLRYATQALALGRQQIASSLPSLQPKRTAWEWVCRSAGHLLKTMAGGSGPCRILPWCCVFLHAASQCRESSVTTASIVFVVDDDPSVRSSLKFLLSTVGLQVESFDSADTFLHKKRQMRPVALC